MKIPQDQNLRCSLDLVMDRLVSGRRLRILTVIDDFAREYMDLVVDTSITGLRVVRKLCCIIEKPLPPAHNRQRKRHRDD